LLAYGGGEHISLLEERVKTLQERRPFIAPQAAANVSATEAKTEKTKKETQFVGQSKAGQVSGRGKVSGRDQDVEAYMRHFEGMPDEEIERQIEMASVARRGMMHQAKQANFDKRRQEILERVRQSQGGSSLSGQRTSKPDGTYQLPDGRTVTVRGGVIQ